VAPRLPGVQRRERLPFANRRHYDELCHPASKLNAEAEAGEDCQTCPPE